MIKADTKVKFEDCKPEKFTNFERLQKEVEILKENVDEMVSILNSNNLTRRKEIEAKYFDDDDVFNRLEEDIK